MGGRKVPVGTVWWHPCRVWMALTAVISRASLSEFAPEIARPGARGGGKHSLRSWPEEKFHTRTTPECAPVSRRRPVRGAGEGRKVGWETGAGEEGRLRKGGSGCAGSTEKCEPGGEGRGKGQIEGEGRSER
eukprot:1168285-Pleurochrysis_carterae.AAC.1